MSKPSETNGAVNIPTRYALVKRMHKLLKEIDDYFEDAADHGLTVAEADPKGEMMAWRKGLVASLEREGRLGIVRMDKA
jgi:hypothetical protein